MKNCIICNEIKDLNEFYIHKKMADGHLNKCKDCTKMHSKKRHYRITSTPEGLEKERARHREKYHRLGYKEKQLEWDKDKPWKKTSTYKNLSRKFKIPVGYELHHWNYNDDYLEDIIIMTIKDHKKWHRFIELDLDSKTFILLDSKIHLNSKERHLSFIIKNGFDYKIINEGF